MEIFNKIKNVIINKIDYWYIAVSAFLVLSVFNFCILPLWIEMWHCGLIEISLVVLFAFYVSVLYQHIKDRVKNFLKIEEDKTIERFEAVKNQISELDNRNTDLFEKLDSYLGENHGEIKELISTKAEDIVSEIKEGAEEICLKVNSETEKQTDFLNNLVSEKSSEIIGTAEVIDERNRKENSERDKKYLEKFEAAEVFANNFRNEENEHFDIITKSFENTQEKLNSSESAIIEKLESGKKNSDEMIEKARCSVIEEIETKESERFDFIIKSIGGAEEKICEKTEELSDRVDVAHKGSMEAIEKAKDSIVEDVAAKGSEHFVALANNINETKEKICEKADELSGRIDFAHEDSLKAVEKAKADIFAEMESETSSIVKISTQMAEEQNDANVYIESKILECYDRICVVSFEAEKALDENREKIIEFVDNSFEEKQSKDDEIASNLTAEIISTKEEMRKGFDLEKEHNSSNEEKLTEFGEKLTELRTGLDEKNKADAARTDEVIQDIASVKQMLEEKTAFFTSSVLSMQKETAELIEKTKEENAEEFNVVFENHRDVLESLLKFAEHIDNEFENLKVILDEQKTEVASSEMKLRDGQKALEYNIDSKHQQSVEELNSVLAEINNLKQQLSVIKSLIKVDAASEESKVKNIGKDERIEELSDGSGAVIYNHFKKSRLVFSEIKKDGKVSYEAEYDDSGNLKKSRNFDLKGNLLNEYSYYENGQVKERVTFKNKEKITERFDKQGNKLR